jgi:DNA-directed RNA polymerase subunit RPC12/RpoP
MFRCARCKNTGEIQEQYVDFFPLEVVPTENIVTSKEFPIKTRTVECPECLGFGAVGWALHG